MSAANDLAQVDAFREALVAHVNLALRDGIGRYAEAGVNERFASGSVRLTREYARLRSVIVGAAGVASMTLSMIGTTSQDVIQDAISRPDHPSYPDVARFAVEHLDRAIGLLQARAERPGLDSGAIYRLTSPVFWIRQGVRGLARLGGWVAGTARGRVVGFVAALVIALVAAIVSGYAGAFFTKLLN